MKRLILTSFAFFIATTLFSQAPFAFNYQGVARDLTGNPMLNKNIGLRISILQGTITGTEVYKELHLVSTNNTGLFNIQIGNGTPVSGSIGSISWGEGPYFLKIEMDENGGSNYKLIGTSQLLSVPYALYAERSGSEIKLLPPTVTTSNATNLGYAFATLNGIVNGNGFKTDVVFEYDTTAQLKNTINATQDPVFGSSNVQVSVDLTGLVPNKVYNFRVKGTNAVGISTGNTLSFILTMNIPCEPCTDVDGNQYKTVQIGNQCWMAENLKTTKYRDGTAIPTSFDHIQWNSLTTGAYAYFRDLQSNGNTYGGLYNFYAATNPKGICPVGWHVPSKDEWSVLFDFLGGISVAGNKLKEEGTTHWKTANGTNVSGFTALAGSWRGGDGLYYYAVRDMGNWWTTTMQASPNYPWFIWIGTGGETYVSADSYHDVKSGNSVRCLKD